MKHFHTFLLLAIAMPSTSVFAQAGLLDNTFSLDGLVSQDLAASSFDEASAVAIQLDGKIVVVGTSGYSKALNFGVARYLTDGTLDTDFNFDGADFTSVVFGDDHATSVVIQDDGKILIGGYGFCTEGNCFAMVRYLGDGTPDPEFGVDGIVTTEFTGGHTLESKAIAVQDDGKILLAGGGVAGFAVVRYLEDGTVDTDFGTDGLATCAFSAGNDRANGIVVLGDGRIILSGYASDLVNDSIAVTRLNPDGTIDTDFGTNGRARASITNRNTIGQALALGPNGEIVVAGYCVPPLATDPTAVIARFTAEGVLDASFNGTGLRQVPVVGSDVSSLNGVAVQPDGKIVACGAVTMASSDFLLVRLNEDGSDDNAFNTTGFVTTDYTGTSDRANAIALQDDGRIVVVGGTNAGTQDYNFAIARYLSDGNVGIADPGPMNAGMDVHPQPITAASVLSYSLKEQDVITVDLYDARGAFVERVLGPQNRSAGLHQETMGLDKHLPAGLYTLRLRGLTTARAIPVVVDRR
ncbi:MAG: hypothetical protein ABI432_13290 [Flavobacteriales bacterium]